MKQNIFYVLLTFLLSMMLYFGVNAYTQAILYEKHTAEMVSHQGAEAQAKIQLEKLAKSILGDFYDEESKITIENIKTKQVNARTQAQMYTLYFMLALLTLLCGYFVVTLRVFTFFGSLGAMLALVFGLMAPILMVTIHTKIEYLGDIVLSFESKGVMGSIAKLWETGDWIVAGVIFIFSVFTPVLKIVSLFFISIFMEHEFSHRIVKFFKMIGKWSMVDVFVVAIFLVYLTANKGNVSRAEVEVGLYFFLAYVIVSMLVSVSADRMLHRLKG